MHLVLQEHIILNNRIEKIIKKSKQKWSKVGIVTKILLIPTSIQDKIKLGKTVNN